MVFVLFSVSDDLATVAWLYRKSYAQKLEVVQFSRLLFESVVSKHVVSLSHFKVLEGLERYGRLAGTNSAHFNRTSCLILPTHDRTEQEVYEH